MIVSFGNSTLTTRVKFPKLAIMNGTNTPVVGSVDLLRACSGGWAVSWILCEPHAHCDHAIWRRWTTFSDLGPKGALGAPGTHM